MAGDGEKHQTQAKRRTGQGGTEAVGNQIAIEPEEREFVDYDQARPNQRAAEHSTHPDILHESHIVV
jgi:hypothetical protein